MKTLQIYGGVASAVVAGGLLILVAPLIWYLGVLVMVAGPVFMFILAARLFAPAYVQMADARVSRLTSVADMALRDRVVSIGERPGYSTKYDANGTIEVIAPQALMRNPSTAIIESEEENEQQQIDSPKDIPVSVRYEDIKLQIPKDHTLVGVAEGGVVHTLEKEAKGLIWIPGSSGAGKSNTTALRVEEDYNRGYKFMAIDPHMFKKDSLSNLVKPYMDQFIEPIAHTSEDILRILNLFIAEIDQRKKGAPCWPLTLLYDEIGSQVSDQPEDEIEKEIIIKTKKVIRQAGQETRGFNMNLVAISQDAAGLAFLRKRALLVLGHKTLMMSERELICNERTDIARQMDEWPIGRTVVYGIALQGTFVRQQPLMLPRSSSRLPDFDREDAGKWSEGNGEDAGRQRDTGEDVTPLVLKNFLNEAGKMRARGDSIDAILKAHGLAPGGRNNQNLKNLLEAQQEQGA